MLNGNLLSSYGAVPDAKHLHLVAIAPGSDLLDHPVGGFVLEDVGKTVAVAGGGGPDALLITTVAEFISPTQVRLATAAATNATAPPQQSATIGTDCGPALQAAIDDGERVFIDGDYALFSGVTKVGSVELAGYGDNSTLRVACPPTVIGIKVTNGVLTIGDIRITGTQGAANDAKHVVRVESGHLRFIRANLFGCMTTAHSVFTAHNSLFTARESYFGGCAASSGVGSSVVDLTLCAGLHVQGNEFLDYGSADGENVWSKTGITQARAWVHVRSMSATQAIHATNQGVLRFIDNRMDEGAVHHILVGTEIGDAGIIDRIVIDGHEGNAYGSGSLGMICLFRVRHAEITRVSQGFVNAFLQSALYVRYFTDVRVDGFQVGRGSTVTAMTVLDGENFALNNSPGFTNYNIQRVRDFSIDRKPGVLQPVGGFKYPPVAGTVAIDEAAKQLCVRTAAGTWLRTTLS